MMDLKHAILRLAAILVPERERRDWLAEWKSELWYVLRDSPGKSLSFCLGAFKDALWMRRNNAWPGFSPSTWMDSPVRCLGTLAVLAVGFSIGFPGVREEASLAVPNRWDMLFAHLLMMAIAFFALPAITSMRLGEYPATWRCRRWMFLGVKFVLIVPIVVCTSFHLGAIGGDAALLGYILGFRWALVDQKRRCPVCLRLLTNPTLIGEASHTFLEWYGTELFCARGHGLLHVPEMPTSYNTQHWSDLDSSWSSLFS